MINYRIGRNSDNLVSNLIKNIYVFFKKKTEAWLVLRKCNAPKTLTYVMLISFIKCFEGFDLIWYSNIQIT